MARRSLGKQLRHAWNAFVADRQDLAIAKENQFSRFFGQATSARNPSSVRLRHSNDKTILTSIYVRMAVDAANVDFRHVRLDDDGQYKEDIKSGLNSCLSVEANVDQSALAFFLDVYLSMFDNGYMAILPTDTDLDPDIGGGWDIMKMRVAEIIQFYPQHVRVAAYDETDGTRKEITIEKKNVAIVYNPFYSVMNDGASVLQRLVRKLAILDTVDEASVNGKLDVLIQLPYTVRGKTREAQAEDKRKFLESQLQDSSLGIGYIDANDKVVQLNRPAENNLMSQIEYLVNLLFSQLGLTPDIMNGSADEKTMLNYMNRTIAPLNKAVKQAMIRSFLTKTARTQGQSIMTFWDPFQLLPLSQIADIADKLSRNEILTPNEIRPKLGFKPHSDPSANQLSNSNMPGGNAAAQQGAPPAPSPDETPGNNQALLDELNGILDETDKEIAAQDAMITTVDDVIQHAVYDPVARRERYLRNRQLKGRHPAQTPPPKAGLGSRFVDSAMPVSTRHSQTSLAAQRQAASESRQVAQIKERLSGLKEKLQTLLAQQKKESSSSSDSKSSDSSSSKSEDKSTGPDKPKTAAQKAAAKKALKKAQQERANQQKTEPDKKDVKTPPTTEEQISHLRSVISDTEERLRAAIARTQTASNGR